MYITYIGLFGSPGYIHVIGRLLTSGLDLESLNPLDTRLRQLLALRKLGHAALHHAHRPGFRALLFRALGDVGLWV